MYGYRKISSVRKQHTVAFLLWHSLSTLVRHCGLIETPPSRLCSADSGGRRPTMILSVRRRAVPLVWPARRYDDLALVPIVTGDALAGNGSHPHMYGYKTVPFLSEYYTLKAVRGIVKLSKHSRGAWVLPKDVKRHKVFFRTGDITRWWQSSERPRRREKKS
jgi:hypothetical protein